MSRGRSWVRASSSSTSTAVDGVRVFPVRFSTGSLSFSNRISPSCFGEPMLKGSPARRKISAASVASSCSSRAACEPSTRASTRTPCAFEAGQDRDERQLEVLVDGGDSDAGQLRAESLGQLPRQVGALAGVVEQRGRRERAEGHRLHALAADVVGGQRLVAELLERHRFQVLARS